jgi:hypothetical protein
MHYWGDDARTVRRARELGSPRAEPLARQEHARDDRTVERRLRLAGRLCDAALVSDLELAQFVAPHVRRLYVVPTPVGPVPAAARGPAADGPPLVFHAPSDRQAKGSATIEPVLRELEAAGVLRARVVSGVPRAEVLASMAVAELVVDQLGTEAPGVLALEAMALGLPVLTEYRLDRLASFARHTPLVRTTAGSLRDDLVTLCDDVTRRSALGEAGRRFVAEIHAADRVVAALERVYAHARKAPPGHYQATAEGLRPLSP